MIIRRTPPEAAPDVADPPEISIRPATEEDIEALVELRVALLRETGNLPDESRIPRLAEAIRAYLVESLPEGAFMAWVAEVEGELVATSGLVFFSKPPLGEHLTGKEAYLMNMYTRPEWRGRGLATQLLERVVAFVRGTDIRRISLHATAEGRPLYLRAGFADSDSEMRLEW
jgi:GNAT superfamily N-acetyltransferase